MKILSTIGPISESIHSIREINKYSEVFRLNGSHNNLNWHKKIIVKIKSLSENNKILLDIPGVKPRTNNHCDVVIDKGGIVCFYYKKNLFSSKIKNIPLSHPLPAKNKLIPRYFSISDGLYLFKIINYNKDSITGVSQQNFTLKSKKGLNIPKSVYDDKRQIRLSLKFLKKISNLKIDAVGLSFVQSEKIIEVVKKKYPNLLIIAKIENSLGLNNVSNIIIKADAIMIDRGDLSAEIGEENLFNAVKEISKQCIFHGKPLIIATENLDSMINNNASPSKSEIISLSFSNSINADLVMLSDETATSKNYIKILKWLSNFLGKNINNKPTKNDLANKNLFIDLLKNIRLADLVLFTKKGYIVDNITRINKDLNLHVFSDNKQVVNKCSFRANVNAILTRRFPKKMENFIYKKIQNYRREIFKNFNKVFLVYANYPIKGSRANTLSILSRKNFI